MFETNYNSVLEKIEKFKIHDYARTRNFYNGHVSMLSPYLSRGLITVSFLIDFFSNKGLRYNQIYKFLLTPKKYRKVFKTINLNISYNFDQKTISLDDIRVDNKFDQNINKIISDLVLKDNNLQNKIYLKKILNKAIKSYSG